MTTPIHTHDLPTTSTEALYYKNLQAQIDYQNEYFHQERFKWREWTARQFALVETRQVYDAIKTRMKHDLLFQQIVFIMKYVISTKHGVVLCWPFRSKSTGQMRMAISATLFQYVVQTFFSHDISVKAFYSTFTLLFGTFSYPLTEEEIDLLNNCLPLQYKSSAPFHEMQEKWISVDIHVVRQLFEEIDLYTNSSLFPKSDFYHTVMKWRTFNGDKKDRAFFPLWDQSDRHKVSFESLKHTGNDPLLNHCKGAWQYKMAWGKPLWKSFFDDTLREALQSLGSNPPGSLCHIGSGWVWLQEEEVLSRSDLLIQYKPKPQTTQPSLENRNFISPPLEPSPQVLRSMHSTPSTPSTPSPPSKKRKKL